MKKRYIYSVLFGFPGLFVSLITALIVFGTAAGFLWIFVYGDNTWPQSVETALPALFVLTFLILWIASMATGFAYGKRLEDDPVLNNNHIWVSIGATTLPIVIIILHQLSVGNIGKASDGKLCSDYCLTNVFSASGMPPKNSGERTCSCYDDKGRESIKVSMDAIINQ